MPSPRASAAQVRYPASRIDKIGVKADSSVWILGLSDAEFEAEVRTRTARPFTRRRGSPVSLVIYRVGELADLDRLAALRGAITQEGAIWVLWRKGQAALTETHVRRAALAQGLVDVKVMAFSAELSALKLVIPRAQRTGQASRREPPPAPVARPRRR